MLTCDRLPALAARHRGTGCASASRPGSSPTSATPDHATRVAILRKRAALDRVPVDEPAVLELIADRVTDQHPRARRRADPCCRLSLAHRSARSTCALATRGAGFDVSPQRRPASPSIDDVQAVVAAHYSLTVAELISPARSARIAWPRQMAIHLARELTGSSLQAIGQAFGGRNHGTVLHACKRVSERLAGDQYIAGELDDTVGGDLEARSRPRVLTDLPVCPRRQLTR